MDLQNENKKIVHKQDNESASLYKEMECRPETGREDQQMECKGAIFDMDGLLFDTERIYQQIWQEIAEKRGIVLGEGFLKAISGTNGAYMCRIIENYYQVSDGHAIMQECMGRVRDKLSVHVPVKKGVYEILDFFQKEGIRMAVASSSAAEQIESNLETAGIREYFSAVVSGMEVRHGKPAPDIFLCAAERIECEPGACFVFEDSENGIKAGHAAGCMAIMVPDLVEASSGILPYCTKICPDLLQAEKEIKAMLRQL